jgi:hypothetical protein
MATLQSLGLGLADEEEVRDFVSFVTADQVADTCLALLGSPAVRWAMEQKASAFIVQDHFEAEVSAAGVGGVAVGVEGDQIVQGREEEQGPGQGQPSSLSLLASALVDLAGEKQSSFLLHYDYAACVLCVDDLKRGM